jgi:HKD family nuclease
MTTSFYTNSYEVKFINKLCECIDRCSAFRFSVSFIKKALV